MALIAAASCSTSINLHLPSDLIWTLAMSRSRSAAPVNGTLPASLILGSREQKQYRRFQAQSSNVRSQALGALPTAEQYAAFQSWCQKNDSGYFSDTPLGDLISSIHRDVQSQKDGKTVGAACGHVLHETQWHNSTRQTVERCPVCTVQMHTVYMDMLMQALKKAGGWMEQRWEAAPSNNPVLEAFYAGKIALIRAIADIEELAVAEENWDESNPASDIDADPTKIKTAQDALRMYWASVESSASDTSSSSSPSMSCSSSFSSSSSISGEEGPRKKQKTQAITFDENTSFERGRHQHYFWRKSPRYEAGGKYEVVSTQPSDTESDTDCDSDSDGEDSRLAIRLDCKELPFPATTVLENDGAKGGDAEMKDDSSDSESEDDEESDCVYETDSEDDEEDIHVDDPEEGSFIEFGY
ncbi:unnamed protein product [Periconia digitata]|uniref:Uncharacterized protein n=1 Tax=Periconia digitata TaxID=1303443 RepID=A0A9W4UPG8_9PLEO|nr:unnamed protein product [Periconia digitata]